MKRGYFFTAGFLAVLMLGALMPAHAADPDTMYVRYIEGSVNLSESGSPQSMEAVVNTPLIEGDTVATGPGGRTELFLKDGSMARIGKNSVMKVLAMDDKGVQFKLEQGSAYIVSQGSREVPIFLGTPLVALDITSPSTVGVDAYSNGINEISVLKGSIFASQGPDRMLVRQGERLILRADGSMPVVARLRAPDDWLRWNTGRDTAAVAGAGTSESYTYLPEELRAYSSDLDTNGQWIYNPEYNYVWVPTVIMVGTWSPYRHGRWAWIRGSYVWVGYEPWGWVPYHYGRWVHDRRAGWCWVPPKHRDVRWEPAHVAWVNSSRHIGWVPLAPGERYDRRSAPVIQQTNVYNTTYKNVTVERSYRNASVVNSMVTVERDRMLRQKTPPVAAPKPGPAMFKKVSLPSTVTPARTQSGLTGRQNPGRSVPPAERETVTSRPTPLSKDIQTRNSSAHAPTSPQPKPPVGTQQLSDTSLNSRVMNARYPVRDNPVRSPRPPQPTVSNRGISGLHQDVSLSDTLKKDAQHTDNAVRRQPVPKKAGVPEVQKTPASQPVQTVPLRERIQTNTPSPAVKAESKPAVPREPGHRYGPAGTPPALGATTAVPQRGLRGNIPQETTTIRPRSVNGGEKAAPGGRPKPQAGPPEKNTRTEQPVKNDARPGPDKNKPQA